VANPLELGENYLHRGPAWLVSTAESISCSAISETGIILCWYWLIQVHMETTVKPRRMYVVCVCA